MTINTNIQGIFKLTSPLHCAAPGEFGINENGYVVPGKTGRPCTATMHQRILADGVRDSIPYFPANDLRGRLRRKAAALVMESLAAMGLKVPVDLYAGLCSGASGARPENDLTIEEAVRASRHIYMGLFGGGTRLLRSGFSIQDVVPIVGSTVRAGMVPEGIGDYAEKPLPASTRGDEDTQSRTDGWKLTDVRHFLRVDDATRVLRPEEITAYVENAPDSIIALQKTVLENRQARKESAEDGASDVKKSDVGNMQSLQSIIPGTELYVRIDLADAMTPAQVGLMLCSLVALVNEQGLGGWVRTGFGRFDAEHFTLTIEGEEVAIFERSQKGDYQLAEALSPYVEAMRSELEALTVADLLEFFTPRKEPVAAKTTKKAKGTGDAVTA